VKIVKAVQQLHERAAVIIVHGGPPASAGMRGWYSSRRAASRVGSAPTDAPVQ
jgi:hypothetical protein